MRESIVIHALHSGATRDAGAALGRALAEFPDATLIIALNGELGAGKTTFVSGLLTALGQRDPVKSPTYTLVESYELSGRAIHHLDLYRLRGEAELESLGFHDLLQAGAVLLIEWAERAEGVLRAADLSVAIEYATPPDAGRQLIFTAGSALGEKLMDNMASSGFSQ